MIAISAIGPVHAFSVFFGIFKSILYCLFIYFDDIIWLLIDILFPPFLTWNDLKSFIFKYIDVLIELSSC